MGVIEKMLLKINPKAACERAYYQNLYKAQDSYTAARRGSGKEGWNPVNLVGEQMNRVGRDIIRARARDLERNDDSFKAIVKDLIRNVVGTGIILQSKIKDDEGDEIEYLNKTVEKAWKKWCSMKNCTVRGDLTFWEVQKLAMRRTFVDGGLLIIKSYLNGRFRLQLVEVDELDTVKLRYGKNRIIGGVEIDEYDRRVAYHLRRQNLDGSYNFETIRVLAEHVIFLVDIERVSEVREISSAASTIPSTDDVHQLLEAAIIKEKIQACFGIAITSEGLGGVGLGRNNPYALTSRSQVEDYEELTPGMIKRLNPGDKIESISPSGMSSTADGMIRTIQRQAGAGVGLSYEATTRDMSQTNYSSARQGLLQDRKTYAGWQLFLIEHMMQPIYEEWLKWAFLSGEIVLPKDFLSNFEKYSETMWIPPGWDWIDPLKEVNANKIALSTHQTTLQKICAHKGEDYKDVIAQRAAEKSLLEKYGLLEEEII